ncbi:MAG: T9SS type A sorting domain-containing protein [Bacteroidetes bacterium]|nr:T9SS type A sorting domain-containing protein [Bacteroidota bacterium]
MKNLSFLCFSLLFFQIGNSQITLLSTDFQSGIPSNYTILNNDGNTPFSTMTPFIGQEAWISFQDPDSTLNQVAAATSYFETADSADRWLITPQITLSSFGNYLSWNAKSHDPSFPDDYLVLLSTTDSLTSSFTDTIGSVEQENFEWTSREVNLSNLGLNDSSIYIAFVLRTYDGFKLYVDDILVRGEDLTGLNESSVADFNVYPNPFSDVIQIESNKSFESISIVDLNGKSLLETTEKTIHLNFLQNGYYLIVLKYQNQLFTYKVLKL